MDGIEEVDIDSNGTFKYILIKLTIQKSGGAASKLIVRGYSWAGNHGRWLDGVLLRYSSEFCCAIKGRLHRSV